MTGQLEEEKMAVYVRLGILLLYKVRAYERRNTVIELMP